MEAFFRSSAAVVVVSRIEVAKVCHDCKVSGSMVASDVATSKFHNRRMKALGVTLPLRPREVGGDKLDHRVRMESVSMKYSSVLNVVGVRELDEDEVVVAEGGLVLLRMNDGSSKGIGLAPRARLGGRSPLSLLPQPIMGGGPVVRSMIEECGFVSRNSFRVVSS